MSKRKKKLEDDKPAPKRGPSLVAKRDFVITHNAYHRVIKEGDDLSDVPTCYIQNLKTENVL